MHLPTSGNHQRYLKMRTDVVGSWNATQMSSMRLDLVEEDAIGKGFDKQTVLSQSQAPLTARRLMDSFSPISNSELLDFGFSHADLF